MNAASRPPSLAALLAKPSRRRTRTPAIACVREAATLADFRCPAATYLDPEAFTQALPEACVAVVVDLGDKIARELEPHPGLLVVILGKASAKALSRLHGEVLGPHAALRVEPEADPVLACAPTKAELEPLERALGRPRVSLSPTPRWLPAWLVGDPELRAVGYVRARDLDARWADCVRAEDALPHVLVALGVSTPDLEEPGDPDLVPMAVAHTLERKTGPLYPAPRVLALVHRGPGPATTPTAEAIELWSQARRALPRLGSVLGMQEPDPRIELTTPTAAFLAQRPLLRLDRCRELERGQARAPLELAPLDPEKKARALSVLDASAEVLSEHESKVVLRGFGIEITRQAVANSASGAAQFAERIGFPVVLKALSPDLRRKSEVGAIKLGLETAAAVKRAYASIVDQVEKEAPTARLDGVVVAELVEPGLEIAVGAVRSRTQGKWVFHGQPVGLSTRVEPALALGPLSPIEALYLAESVLSRIPVPALRRASDPDARILASLFLCIGALIAQTDDRLRSVDLRPIRLVRSDREYVTLDARIVQSP